VSRLKKIIKKIIPSPLINLYHLNLAVLANLLYGFPSRKLKVIGVTGTNGKTSTCNLIWKILTQAGYKTGLTSSINFKIGKKSWINKTKQGMQGRFKLQKLLYKMNKAGCQYAVIETTSEGIKQFRHWGILYDVVVFTNLTPEHIESHGSFEKYKQAKGKLFNSLKQQNLLSKKKDNKKVSVINLDDEHHQYFLKFEADEKWGYSINQKSKIKNQPCKLAVQKSKILTSYNLRLTGKYTQFKLKINGQENSFKTHLLGKFNIYNCLAAIAVGLSQNIDIKIIKKVLENIPGIAGRMEKIDCGQNFTVVVDYAHDPAALKNVYQTLHETCNIKDETNIIAVLGAVGGGRDTAKRKPLGQLAAKYCNYVIVTNEDPYDDDPMKIIRQVETGVKKQGSKTLNKNYWVIKHRQQAIKKALSLAQKNDIVIISGKGAEETMAVKGGYIPWDDRQVVREILSKLCP